MIVVAVVLIIMGFISCYYGIEMNNDMDMQMESLFGSGKTDPGSIYILIGVALILSGLVLLIWEINHAKKTSASSTTPPSVSFLKQCTQCGNRTSDNFAFCPICGGQMQEIWQQCPACKRMIIGEDIQYCPGCGDKMPNIVLKSAEEEQKRCSNCGVFLDDSCKYCPGCGNKISVEF